ncbi:TetR/AcrR family transcriptional regulator [Thiomicrorhabdus heinhorstiae]|uniref:TetR/AcrR family transcriptional regulator n=1 Tax=Thiomicrorhabdus heinhorstiae TaxID=2748010 RepID=A0ABS0BU86_9GAMM|nr:TetR/AcrR family transcriptional regulator [Thiomicrorhabdus heinhorstiae]MBF6057405.1 TetR/AcrR family transcriptional regulator [Thiomicrorhabdus heinhorstiae]
MTKKTTHNESKPLPARERILVTAHDLFYREGIRATGVDRLIKESAVTKVTFYRHFPSKNDLILAFLHYRHQRWMNWFSEALRQGQNQPQAIVDALSEWFSDVDYRGCAFINSVSELAKDLPEVVQISREHKRDMSELVMQLLPQNNRNPLLADAISLAIDGAIIRAQYGEPVTQVLESFRFILDALLKSHGNQ